MRSCALYSYIECIIIPIPIISCKRGYKRMPGSFETEIFFFLIDGWGTDLLLSSSSSSVVVVVVVVVVIVLLLLLLLTGGGGGGGEGEVRGVQI